MMSGLISRNALCEYCLNTKDRTTDADGIMRFPSAEPERMEDHICQLCNCYDKQSCYGIYCKSCGYRMDCDE